MQLDIYAWNAGNLDGASGTYEGADSEKTRAQYPNGYASLAKAAGAIGTKFGAWYGPDGLGSTEEKSRERYELMVSLCRDYNFGLFKMDGVCGDLRPEKQELFVSMMKECRKYSPELILLNHRLNLGEGMPYATTSLWNGQETYVDVFISNHCPAPHNRAYIFDRGNTPGPERLIEDHGVCLSSCLDYFEDDLIYQAFGRSLILAPEIYGNPWFLRDDEQAKLARIYNLHRTYGKILVSGVLLPPNYGPSAVSRGDGKTRFITTGNKSWSRESISVNLNSEIGLERHDGKIVVAIHHPYERVVGVYSYGDRVAVDIPPFRACLIEVSYQETFRQMLSGCEYEVLHETEGRADRVKLLHVYDTVRLTENGDDGIAIPEAQRNGKFDNTIADPIKLGTTYECEIPSNAEQLLETAHFVMDMDSFEARSLKRSGDTKIPEVKAARDAFFNQETYILRGCESKYAFDGKNDTFFDGLSKTDGSRDDGGCLRVDFGGVYNADYLAIEYFDADEPIRECVKQEITPRGDFSTDLAMFKDSYLYLLETVCNDEVGVLAERVHNIIKCKGRRCRACYEISGEIRYFRLPRPVDRIYKISLIKNGVELQLDNPHVNNLLPSCKGRQVFAAREAVVRVTGDIYRKGCYIAVAIAGVHGVEGAYAIAEDDNGKLYGFPGRAPSYLCNAWETRAIASQCTDRMYTYYLPVSESMVNRDLKIRVVLCNRDHNAVFADVYLCDANNEREGVIIDL